jgi:hypothetical protein
VAATVGATVGATARAHGRGGVSGGGDRPSVMRRTNLWITAVRATHTFEEESFQSCRDRRNERCLEGHGCMIKSCQAMIDLFGKACCGDPQVVRPRGPDPETGTERGLRAPNLRLYW